VSPSLIGSARPIVTLINLSLVFWNHSTSWPKHGYIGPERHHRSASKPSYDPNSLWANHRLVLTGWWAHPNCNIVLNCAGLFRRILRQKLQDGKRISFLEFVKRHMCNTHWNEWHITRGTQPERRVLCLESYCCNKLDSCPKLTTSIRIIIESLSCLFQSHGWCS
jgi:hypothetical protein